MDVISELDDAWERINALGGKPRNDFEAGVNHAVEQALTIIEELGGKDPAPARARILAAMAALDRVITGLR
jgi:hypothetical protein